MIRREYLVDQNCTTPSSIDQILLAKMHGRIITIPKNKYFSIDRNIIHNISEVCNSYQEIGEQISMNIVDFFKLLVLDEISKVLPNKNDIIKAIYMLTFNSSYDIVLSDGEEISNHELDLMFANIKQPLASDYLRGNNEPLLGLEKDILEEVNIEVMKIFYNKDYAFEKALYLMMFNEKDFYIVISHHKDIKGVNKGNMNELLICEKDSIARYMDGRYTYSVFNLTSIISKYIQGVSNSYNNLQIKQYEKDKVMFDQIQSYQKIYSKSINDNVKKRDQEVKLSPANINEINEKYQSIILQYLCNSYFGIHPHEGWDKLLVSDLKDIMQYKESEITIKVENHILVLASANITDSKEMRNNMKEFTLTSGSGPSYITDHQGIKNGKIRGQKDFRYKYK